jgi:nitrogen fixation protein NifU and related proteins
MMYNKTVLDCFFSPRHVGVIDLNQDLVILVKNNQKGQADIALYMQSDAHKVIQKVCYKTNGNPYLIAGLEWLCREVVGQAIDSLVAVDYQRLIKELDIPMSEYPLAVRIVEVFKKAISLT